MSIHRIPAKARLTCDVCNAMTEVNDGNDWIANASSHNIKVYQEMGGGFPRPPNFLIICRDCSNFSSIAQSANKLKQEVELSKRKVAAVERELDRLRGIIREAERHDPNFLVRHRMATGD